MRIILYTFREMFNQIETSWIWVEIDQTWRGEGDRF